jgi:hypothetical protein
MNQPRDQIRCGADARAERDRRLAAALRENLRRRKEQARAQGALPPESSEKKPQRSA